MQSLLYKKKFSVCLFGFLALSWVDVGSIFLLESFKMIKFTLLIQWVNELPRTCARNCKRWRQIKFMKNFIKGHQSVHCSEILYTIGFSGWSTKRTLNPLKNCLPKWKLSAKTSRSFHCWKPAPRGRPLPCLTNTNNPAMSPHMEGGKQSPNTLIKQ